MTNNTTETETPKEEQLPIEPTDIVPEVNDEEASLEKTEETEQPLVIDGVTIEGPDGFKKAINKQHYRYKEEERKRQALEKEIEELRSKVPQTEEILEPVAVPGIPDPWEDDYEAKIKARDEAILHNAKQHAQASLKAQQEAEQQQQQQKKQQEYIQGLENQFLKNTETLKLDAEEVTKAAQTVAQHGLNGEIAHFLMTDADGPNMVRYLAANPIELDDLSRMQPLQAGLKMNELRAKAAALRPKTTEAPKPATILNGKTPLAERGPKGATFE